MSRSYKQPIYKDRGMTTGSYWRVVRHDWKQHLRMNYLDEDLAFRNQKSIINDYDRCDWITRGFRMDDWWFGESQATMINGKLYFWK